MKALLLEGPEHSVMRGWRHFLIVTPDRRASVMGVNGSGPGFARELGAEFFPAGSWEADISAGVSLPAPLRFSVPSPDVLSLLNRETQSELSV